MRTSEIGKRAMWAVLVVAAPACESRTEIGSACPDGVCPQQLSQRTVCQVTATAADLRVPDSAGGLTSVCLPRALPTNADGRIACTVRWRFDASTDSPCAGRSFLGADPSAEDSNNCIVHQLSAAERAEQDTDGWYYDEGRARECPHDVAVTFSPGAHPEDVEIDIACTTGRAESADGGSADVDADECALITLTGRDDVGEACLPTVIPEGGFTDLEATLEANSPDCGGGACLTYRLNGDPSPDCESSSGTRCADPEEIDDRVYCTCRCDAPEGDPGPFCDCPRGFSCVGVLESGSPSTRGSYCVRNGTFVPDE